MVAEPKTDIQMQRQHKNTTSTKHTKKLFFPRARKHATIFDFQAFLARLSVVNGNTERMRAHNTLRLTTVRPTRALARGSTINEWSATDRKWLGARPRARRAAALSSRFLLDPVHSITRVREYEEDTAEYQNINPLAAAPLWIDMRYGIFRV